MGRHQATKNTILILASAAFSLLTIEGFLAWKPSLQARLPNENVVACGDPAREGRRHPQFGWTGAPGSAYFVEMGEADGWKLYINNAEGFRDLYDSGKRNVIVLGDSFTEGVNANNDEAFPHLLDVWDPNLAFHNSGMSGYATSNALAVYRDVAPRMQHDLVILAYFMGNDLRDNLERRGQAASPDQAADETWFEFFQRVNSDIRQHVRVYNLLYAAVRSQLGRDDLSEGELKEGVRITDDLLADLVAEVRSNDADLLLMVLPSWNQMRGYADAGEEEAQRRLLRKHAEQSEHVYLLDLTAEIERVAVDSFYGVNDKHFSVLGYYLTAKLAHEWINSEWPGEPQTARIVPAFHDRVAALEPDCATVAEYREAFSNPPDADSELASGRP